MPNLQRIRQKRSGIGQHFQQFLLIFDKEIPGLPDALQAVTDLPILFMVFLILPNPQGQHRTGNHEPQQAEQGDAVGAGKKIPFPAAPGRQVLQKITKRGISGFDIILPVARWGQGAVGKLGQDDRNVVMPSALIGQVD